MVGAQALWELAQVAAEDRVLGLVAWIVLRRRCRADQRAAARWPLSATSAPASGRAHAACATSPLVGLAVARPTTPMAAAPDRASSMRMSQAGDQARSTSSPRATRTMKGAIRSRQLAISRNRMMADVADGRRRARQPHPRRRRPEVRARQGAPRWSPRAPASSPPASASEAEEHRVPDRRATSRSPGRCTPPARSARRSPPSCTTPSPRSSRSSSACARAGPRRRPHRPARAAR